MRLDAIDNGRETKETIWVEVAGDEPKLTIGSISEADVRRWRADLLSGGVSPVTAAKAYRLLKGILATATEDGLIPRNAEQGAAAHLTPGIAPASGQKAACPVPGEGRVG